MAISDRLERLTDLVLVMLDAKQPMTLDEICRAVPGYPADVNNRRQAFERDKRLLREEGIPVLTEQVAGNDQFGYRIDRDAYYLGDLGLSDEEQLALNLAVAGVDLGDLSSHTALLKIGTGRVGAGAPVAALRPTPALVALFASLRSNYEVVIGYRGEKRHVSEGSLWFRGGYWYLTGWDRARRAQRTFRVDRIEGKPEITEALDPAATGEREAKKVPEVAGRSSVGHLWPGDHDSGEELVVRVDQVEAARVCDEVGDAAVIERREDGSVLVQLKFPNLSLLRSWVFDLLDHARVIGPAPTLERHIAWLSAIAEASRHSGGTSAETSSTGDLFGSEPSRGSEKVRLVSSESETAVETVQRLDSKGRLRRLLAIVAWLARVGESTVEELSERFGISEEELVRELELAACCGIPPYSPDALMEIVVSDGYIKAFLPKEMARPRRMTPSEGFALAASARTILAVCGADDSGALASALSKLESALGNRDKLQVALDQPRLLEEVRALVDPPSRALIEYYSASSDEVTSRVVDPIKVISIEGHWYLDGFCHRANGLRRFRVDRIRSVSAESVLDEPLEVATIASDKSFIPDPESTEVELVIDDDGSWILDSVPVTAARREQDGSIHVVVAVGGVAWLERLLLRLGPHGRVVAPAGLAGAGAAAARRLLNYYE